MNGKWRKFDFWGAYTQVEPPTRRRDFSTARRRRYLDQFEAVDTDGTAELCAFADGDAGQVGIYCGADVVRRFFILLYAFHKVRDHRGEGMVIDVAGFFDACVKRGKSPFDLRNASDRNGR